MQGEIMNDTVPSTLIMRANLNNFSTEEKARREEALKNKDFFYSRQEQYLLKVNDDVDPVVVNFTYPLVKKRASLLYSRPLVREIDGPASSAAYLENVIDELLLDSFLQKADLAAELTGTSLIHVGLEDGKIKLRLFDASEFSAIGDYNTENQTPKAISLISLMTTIEGSVKDPSVKRALRSEVWTDQFITTFTDGVRYESIPNELGYLPFVVIKGEEVYGQYLGHSPTLHIRQMNQAINQQLTNCGYMIKMQSATPIVLTGFQQGEGIVVHPGQAISLPNGADAKTLTLAPKITETLEETQYLEKLLYESTGIPKVSVVGDEKSNSGRELLIKWYPLIEIFSEKALRYQKYETQLANMILKVAGMEPIKAINVKYPEESILPSVADQAELEFKFKYGISTPIDEVLTLDPSLSEQEAEALVMANKTFNSQLIPAVDPLQQGGPDARTANVQPKP
jgi:hypothetical protein